MNTEQERTEFEAWYRLHHGSRDVYGRDVSGEYVDKQVQGAFNVWQARSALTAQPAAATKAPGDEGASMKERPIIFSVTTGQPSQRGKRLKAADGLTWKQRNRDAVNARRRELYAADPEKHRERQRAYKKGEAKPRVLAANRAWSAEYRAQLRAEMIAAYGGRCACCGEAEEAFLQLDHVENDGHLDRKAHKTSAKLFAVLKRLGWPRDRYQLLCANCNFGKLMNGGVCPHQQREAACA